MTIEVRKPTEEERKKASSWPIWTKEASCFPWRYDMTETCLILEGEVTVKTAQGTVSFKAGDWVVFPSGLECVWTVKKSARKRYHFS
jgi:uncharacterized cupin superfamily protein